MKKLKKVKMRLDGLDGNAYALMGEFEREALEQKIPQTQINDVIDEMKSGDYDNLLRVLQDHTIDPAELNNRIMGMKRLHYSDDFIIKSLYEARGNDYDMRDIKAALKELSEEK